MAKVRSIPTKILDQRLTAAGTKLYLNNIKDWDATALTSAVVPALMYVTLRNYDRSQLEIIEVDGTTIAEAITDTGATINKRACGYEGGITTGIETAYDWNDSETFVELCSDTPQILNNMVDIDRAQTITGKKTHSVVPASTAAAVTGNDLVNKTLLDATALGTTTVDRVIIAGTAGETIAAGEIIYFNTTDKEWKLADASAAATADNVQLGVAQGVGTNGVAISGGVLISGIDTNQTAMTAGTVQYLSDTAGALSETAGTVEVTLGFSNSGSTTDLVFVPRNNQQITEDQQDALAGTSGTPSAGNLYATELGIQRGVETYAADAGANDTYVITLDPVPAAYLAGMTLKAKFNTANTGACTINVNSLGAKSIKKYGDAGLQDLDDNDIQAAQIAIIIYDGTQFLLQGASFISRLDALDITDAGFTALHDHENLMGTGSAIDKTYHEFTIPFLQGSIQGTVAAAGTIWALVNETTAGIYFGGHFMRWVATSDANQAQITTASIDRDTAGGDTLRWDDAKKIIVEFTAAFAGASGEQGGFGLVATIAPLYDYDDATVAGANFSFNTDGKLYAHTSSGAGGAAHTEDEITGITVTNRNVYRIEVDPGVDVKFYVNGTLESTIATNLPAAASDIKFGHGSSGTTTNNYITYITAPYFSIEI